MKKKLIAASMAAAMTLSLAACGGSGASSTASAGDTASTAASTEAASGDEQINLRMAWWGSQDRHDKTIAAIELYESLNPNVKIEYEYYSFDDYFTKLKTLVASDQVWDVFQMGGNFPMYIDKICRSMTTLPPAWSIPPASLTPTSRSRRTPRVISWACPTV